MVLLMFLHNALSIVQKKGELVVRIVVKVVRNNFTSVN